MAICFVARPFPCAAYVRTPPRECPSRLAAHPFYDVLGESLTTDCLQVKATTTICLDEAKQQ